MRTISLSKLLLGCLIAVSARDGAGAGLDKACASETYPTEVVADYVIGCMIANGQSAEAVRKCSCSLDIIAAAIPYQEYERVEALLRLQQMPGVGRNAIYKGSSWAKDAVERFREVQAESTLRCF